MIVIAPEISAVSDTAITICCATADDDSHPRPHDVEVVLKPAEGGPARRVHLPADEADPESGLRQVTIDGLEPGTDYEVDIHGNGHTALPDLVFFPNEVRTLDSPPGERICTIATVSDLHFGEEVCGLGPSGRETPVFRARDEDPPYWHYMNHAIVDEIAKAGVDAVVVKGDITGDGHAHEFESAREAFDRLPMPWHSVMGNHDRMQDGVDGFAVLSQPDDPARAVDVDGVRLVLIDTVDPGRDGGTLPPDRRSALADVLADGHGAPTLAFAHHYTSSPKKRTKKAFGLSRPDSEALLTMLAAHPEVGGFFAGHTHRNRVRRFAETGAMPHGEVCATKDYPGAWASYRVHEGGYVQQVHRCGAPRALAWSHRAKDMYFGLYRAYAIGTLAERCFSYRWDARDRG